MSDNDAQSPPDSSHIRTWRVLIIGVVATVVVLGFALIVMAIGQDVTAETQVNALARSNNECVRCHRETTPGIVTQYGHSTMAAADVTCEDCHEVAADYPGAVEHEGTFVLASPTTAMCETCHQAEVAQFNASRHGLPAYVAMVGLEGLTDEQLALYRTIPEAQPAPNEMRNALFEIEGP